MRAPHAKGDPRKYRVNPETDCWEWVGAMCTDGYGRARHPVTGKVVPAHRLIWELETGRPPRASKELDHLCAVRCCVNPEHLEEVDHRLNRPGVQWDVQYFSPEDEEKLIRLWEAGCPIRTICEELFCSRPSVVLGLRRAGLYVPGRKLKRRVAA